MSEETARELFQQLVDEASALVNAPGEAQAALDQVYVARDGALADIEAESAAIVAAAAATLARYAPARAALASAATGAPWYLAESGREGIFVFDSSNLSASVTADPAQGVYIAKAGDPTGASGAWVRRHFGAVNVDWFGAKGDGATNDTAAIQAGINALSALYLADGRPRTLAYSPGKTYVVRGVILKPGVNHVGTGGATLLKTPAGAITDETVLKWWRIFDMSTSGDFDTAASVAHRIRIEGLIFDGNLANMNWTNNSYNQEQGACLALIGSSAITSAAIRAKFHVRNCEFRNSVGDGILAHINADIIIESAIATNCFRGGLTVNGGNSRIKLRGYRGEDAKIDVEIVSSGYGGSYATNYDFDDVVIDQDTGLNGQRLGGIDLGGPRGGTARVNRARVYSKPFNYDMGTEGGDFQATNSYFTVGADNASSINAFIRASGLFRDCHFKCVADGSGTNYYAVHARPVAATNRALVFERCRLELDASVKTANPSAVCRAFYSEALADGAGMSVEFRDCETIGAWDVGYSLNLGGVLIVDGGRHSSAALFNMAGTTGRSVQFTLRGHHVLKSTVTALFLNTNQAFQAGNTHNYMAASFSAAMNLGAGNPSSYDVTGYYRFPTAAKPTIGAVRGTRAEVNQAPNGSGSADIVVTEYIAKTTSSAASTWLASKWNTNKGATANRPTLTSSDVGVTFLDTTLAAAGKLITWSGTAWVDATGAAV